MVARESYKAAIGHTPKRADEAGRTAIVDRVYAARLAEPFERLRDPAMSLINRQRDALTRPEALQALIREERRAAHP